MPKSACMTLDLNLSRGCGVNWVNDGGLEWIIFSASWNGYGTTNSDSANLSFTSIPSYWSPIRGQDG
jgi:hypothetical protein